MIYFFHKSLRRFFHLFRHQWSNWEVVRRGKTLDSASGKDSGYFVEQIRFCRVCNKAVLRDTQI